LTGKILHFANTKTLDLSAEEAQYFIDVTGARAISGYGTAYNRLSSINLDKTFFSLCQDEDDLIEIVKNCIKTVCALQTARFQIILLKINQTS
jgi:hypothetical protein